MFVLIGSDADLTLLKKLGVKTEPGKLSEVPVYDPETFETNVRGVYVVGHFTHARHIKAAIDVPRRIVPLIARELRQAVILAVPDRWAQLFLDLDLHYRGSPIEPSLSAAVT